MKYFKLLIKLIVFIGFSASIAGSYEDFFKALDTNELTVAQSLLSRGFDPNAVAPDGEPAIIRAVRREAFQVAELIARFPVAQVDARNKVDETALMLAALKGQLALCKMLVERGADINKPGWTPLHYASTSGHLAVMQWLLQQHAYIDAESPNGSTPLMMAAMYGTQDAVELLLDAGADPSLKNSLGLTAIDFAMRVRKDGTAESVAAAIRARKPKGGW